MALIQPAAWPLRRTLGVLLLVMVAVFAGAAVVAGLSMRGVVGRVGRTSANLTRLSGTADRLLAGMLTQQALARGYALSGDAQIRRQFETARADFVRAVTDAEKLPDLDATSRDLLRQQRAIADRWLETIGRREIALRDAGQDAQLQQFVQQGGSARALEEFRAANTDFRQHLESVGRREAADVQSATRRSGVLVVLAIFAAGLSGLGVILYLRHGVQTPLERLTHAVAAVRGGRLDVRVEESGAKEFRALESAFNEMVSSMELAEGERARLEQLKTDFISVVSHELRTPLTAIKGYTEMVLDGDAGAINAEQRDYLDTALSNTDRLVDLVNDLLDLSRIESGRFEIEREHVDVEAVVQEALRTMHPMIEAREQRLNVEIAAGLPAVEGDRHRLTQVLVNLISNANKYTPAGGTITVSAERGAGEVVLVVRDTGVGMRPEDQTHLFERFYRVHDAGTREVTGTGLGLAITKSIVELHGGRITVQSALSVGSRFEVRLPAAPPQSGPSPREPQEVAAGARYIGGSAEC